MLLKFDTKNVVIVSKKDDNNKIMKNVRSNNTKLYLKTYLDKGTNESNMKINII